MIRSLGWATAILLLAAGGLSAQPPNVVLIAIDDLNSDLGCYGHKVVHSPNIDLLAARGVTFTHAYCQYPLCNPSRVSLLSGRRPDATGVMDLQTPPRTHLKDVVFLPQYFRQQGIWAGHVGKIFHTGSAFEDPPSWDFAIRETGKHPPQEAIAHSKRIDRPLKNDMEWHMLHSSDAETADGVVARKAGELLRERAATQRPFFLAVGFRRPHQPYAAPSKYFDLYSADKIPPLAEPAEHLQKIPPAALTYPPGTAPLSPAERQEVVAAYYACISFVDAQVGHVMKTISDLDLWKNTIVVLYGDHGYHLGEHGGLWHKMSLFEQSAHVPLIVAAPKIGGVAQACQRVVELVDVYPTLVDLCGLPAVKELEGKSLRPLLNDPKHAWTDVAFTQVKHGDTLGRSVRTARWRYTEWDEGRAGAELYDHDADPAELVNLADDPDRSKDRETLRQLLRSKTMRPD